RRPIRRRRRRDSLDAPRRRMRRSRVVGAGPYGGAGDEDLPVRIVPANEVPWPDLLAIFGKADYAARCHCQRLKVAGWIWRDSAQEQRTAMLRDQTACGDPDAPATSGLVAYV